MKKVLIITYYWPPAGGPGVQRWLKFVKYLPEFNVEPIVYIPENPNYPILDKSLVDQVPSNITILKEPIKEPYKLAGLFSKKSKTISKGIIKEQHRQSLVEKLMLYIRGNFFIPDARKNWVSPSVKYLSDYLENHAVDAIITSGPPHSLHLIGHELKAQIGVKWIADFRDPWTTIGYHKKLKLTSSSEKKHQQFEAKVLNTADQIIVTSQVTKDEFALKTKQPIEVITNGYDDEMAIESVLDKKFTLSHIGSLLSERNPENLWKVLDEIINEDEDFANHFQLHLIGTTSEDVLQSIYKHNLKAYTSVIGYVPHQKAIAYQNQSQVLLLIEIDSEDTKCIIPGKLFEYMISKRPIIALGPEGSDVASILKETNTGQYFLYKDQDALKSKILTYFEAYKQGHLKTEATGLHKYSRKSLTKSLAELL